MPIRHVAHIGLIVGCAVQDIGGIACLSCCQSRAGLLKLRRIACVVSAQLAMKILSFLHVIACSHRGSR